MSSNVRVVQKEPDHKILYWSGVALWVLGLFVYLCSLVAVILLFFDGLSRDVFVYAILRVSMYCAMGGVLFLCGKDLCMVAKGQARFFPTEDSSKESLHPVMILILFCIPLSAPFLNDRLVGELTIPLLLFTFLSVLYYFYAVARYRKKIVS